MLLFICIFVVVCLVAIHLWVIAPGFRENYNNSYRPWAELSAIVVDGVFNILSQIKESRKDAMIRKKEFQIRKLQDK